MPFVLGAEQRANARFSYRFIISPRYANDPLRMKFPNSPTPSHAPTQPDLVLVSSTSSRLRDGIVAGNFQSLECARPLWKPLGTLSWV